MNPDAPRRRQSRAVSSGILTLDREFRSWLIVRVTINLFPIIFFTTGSKYSLDITIIKYFVDTF